MTQDRVLFIYWTNFSAFQHLWDLLDKKVDFSLAELRLLECLRDLVLDWSRRLWSLLSLTANILSLLSFCLNLSGCFWDQGYSHNCTTLFIIFTLFLCLWKVYNLLLLNRRSRSLLLLLIINCLRVWSLILFPSHANSFTTFGESVLHNLFLLCGWVLKNFEGFLRRWSVRVCGRWRLAKVGRQEVEYLGVSLEESFEFGAEFSHPSHPVVVLEHDLVEGLIRLHTCVLLNEAFKIFSQFLGHVRLRIDKEVKTEHIYKLEVRWLRTKYWLCVCACAYLIRKLSYTKPTNSG